MTPTTIKIAATIAANMARVLLIDKPWKICIAVLPRWYATGRKCKPESDRLNLMADTIFYVLGPVPARIENVK